MITVRANIGVSRSPSDTNVTEGINTQVIEFFANNTDEYIVDTGLGLEHQLLGISVVQEYPEEIYYAINLVLEVVDSGSDKIIRLMKAEASLSSVIDGTDPFTRVGLTGSIKIATPSPDLPDVHPVEYSGYGTLDIVTMPATEFENSGRVILSDLVPYNVDYPYQTIEGEFSYASIPWTDNRMIDHVSWFHRYALELPRVLRVSAGVSGTIGVHPQLNTYQFLLYCNAQTTARVTIDYRTNQ
ncbi:hypothetical protein SAMN04489761_3073 [Tenacibaculum sp. MAR_2009_124]|uniref:hypothetical protein n=1 Tax=Tenacibaculum sp. MAR_2009_124 TaxID=1250059 RepID=UPI0008951926|nr:hypothetical protein [Tenacibaculum sp. MAR_2009_124]SEC46677.1 hypothetical protein SAMN04489761_3073 [Tenacibaculum sp. MAR_2009_124]